MYIPDISAAIECGNPIPPLTEFQRQETLSFEALFDTMKCLYRREFRPIFFEQNCPCITCYDVGSWNHMIHHSTKLNDKCIWNDIIKRWEPTDFNQDFTEEVDENMNYEFRPYNSVFGIDVDDYESVCYDDIFTETPRGKAFIKAFYGENTDYGC